METNKQTNKQTEEELDEELIKKEIYINPFGIGNKHTFKSSKDIAYCFKLNDPRCGGYIGIFFISPGVKTLHKILFPENENSSYHVMVLSFPQDGLYTFEFQLGREQFLYHFEISDSSV